MTAETAVDNDNKENVDAAIMKTEQITSSAMDDDEDVTMKENTSTSAGAVPVTPISCSIVKKAITKQTSDDDDVFSPQLLKMYYSRLFPFELLYSWLSYDPLGKQPQIFSRREFSFTIEAVPGEEIYIRYQSFSSEQELKDAIMKREPRKIDIGAVFSHPPKDKNAIPASDFITSQRELVFDIDLTDYDEIRNCGCSEAKICHKCWKFMTMAVKVMDCGLREDFGFEQIGWFYSGRRGVHAWICDESARQLSNEARAAVANYFEVSLSKKKGEGLPRPLHPMLARAFDILEPMFIESVISEKGHGLLAHPDQWEPLLDTLPPKANEIVGENLREKWTTAPSTPAEKWQELKSHLNVVFGKNNATGQEHKRAKHVSNAEKERIESWPVEVVFKYTYPRLDINVSKMQNHLLKSPFCVHPKTGRVCVPIQVDSVEDFDPFTVPTLPQLMKELDEHALTVGNTATNNNESESRNTKDWQKTSLKDYFEPFQKNFLNPMLKDLRRKAREEAEEREAWTGTF